MVSGCLRDHRDDAAARSPRKIQPGLALIPRAPADTVPRAHPHFANP
jgi:hypothetical protein